MNKIKLGVIFGGMSTEHEISCVSASSIMKNLNNEKYDIYPIFINKKGEWFGDREEKKKIQNIIQYLQSFDVIFHQILSARH